MARNGETATVDGNAIAGADMAFNHRSAHGHLCGICGATEPLAFSEFFDKSGKHKEDYRCNLRFRATGKKARS